MKTMLRPVCAGLLVLVMAAFLPMYHVLGADRIAVDVDQRVRAATVMVFLEYDYPNENRVSWGTGFVIGDGLIMTNAHVVSDNSPSRIYVQNDYLPPTEARVVSARYDTGANTVIGRPNTSYFDVALLSFTPPANVRLPALAFSLNAAPNLDIFAYGYPGANQPVSQYGGRVVPQARQTVNGGYINDIINATPTLLMHDAFCMFGNSGGPLVDERGGVVGMQTWSADPDYNNIVTSFAISSQGLVAFAQSAGARPTIAR